jgi:hypothetical protein
MGFFSDQKSSPTRDWAFVPTGLYFLLPVMSINLQALDGSGGMIVLWLNRVYLETRELNPRSSIFDQRKSHCTIDQRKSHCTILPLDSRNQESAHSETLTEFFSLIFMSKKNAARATVPWQWPLPQRSVFFVT